MNIPQEVMRLFCPVRAQLWHPRTFAIGSSMPRHASHKYHSNSSCAKIMNIRNINSILVGLFFLFFCFTVAINIPLEVMRTCCPVRAQIWPPQPNHSRAEPHIRNWKLDATSRFWKYQRTFSSIKITRNSSIQHRKAQQITVCGAP